MSEKPSTTPPPENVIARPPAKFSSPLFLWPAAIVLAVLLYFGLKSVANFLTHESTDDAFIAEIGRASCRERVYVLV